MRTKTPQLTLQERLPQLPADQLWRVSNTFPVETQTESYTYEAADRFYVQLLQRAPKLFRRDRTIILCEATIYPRQSPRRSLEDLTVEAAESIMQQQSGNDRLGERIREIVGDYS